MTSLFLKEKRNISMRKLFNHHIGLEIKKLNKSKEANLVLVAVVIVAAQKGRILKRSLYSPKEKDPPSKLIL